VTEPPKELRRGRYTILRVLGEGTQGETYEAIDNGILRATTRDEPLVKKWDRYVERARTGEVRDTKALVAIKCFRVKKAKAWKDVELAEREARTLASLDHPHLPRYIEHFEEDGALYLVMEKIEGESVAALRGKRTWSVDEVTRMLRDVGDALRYLHGRTPFIVHRDVKPANIIRRPDGSFALVDFGAVRDSLKPAGGSTIVGTFGYMAPEQFQGRASPKSDVYGLGATAIAMLTGMEPEDLPHEGLGIDVQRALPKGTPERLVRALSAMLVPDPDRRVDSIDEALAFLRAPNTAEREESAAHAKLGRRERREQRAREKREARELRRRSRELARARAVPFVPRLIAKLGLAIAKMAVWVSVGIVVPIVLTVLSLFFGGALRRAAKACMRAARRANARMGDASAWLSGHRREDTEAEAVRIRVHSELDEVRAVTPSQAQALAIKEASEARARGERVDPWIDEPIGEEIDEEVRTRRLLRRPLTSDEDDAKRAPRGR